MGKLFGWLNRSYAEGIEAYNSRMNRLPLLHAGYVFFDWVNYDTAAHSFSVYIEWNGELNQKLQDSMPQGGYAFRCSQEEAACYINEHNGSPVYVKLHAKCGRLYIKHLYFNDSDKQYELFFNGCDVVPPEMVCFWGRVPVEKMDFLSVVPEETEKNADDGMEKLQNGSYRRQQSSFRGSRRRGHGSYRVVWGSHRGISGSYRSMWNSFLGMGSGYRGISGSYRGLTGSYRSLTGSYRSISGSYRSMTGSYRSISGSYRSMIGSYRGISGSYRNQYGSYRGIGGSYYGMRDSYFGMGSDRILSDVFGRTLESGQNFTNIETDNMVDNALGYGLDLIW